MKNNWFAEWFDSKYYHILYQHRDYAEAQLFMDNLVAHLDVPPHATIWDLACGKGRHSIYLAEKGFDVTGTDLSVQSITAAREFEHTHLSFFQHDMRDGFRINYFDYVFNLFTSFGYFDNDKDDLKVLKNIAKSLKNKGVFVMDFLNVHHVTANLVPKEHQHQEKVRAFTRDELTHLFTKAGLAVNKIFGDYQLNEFDQRQSPRLILTSCGVDELTS